MILGLGALVVTLAGLLYPFHPDEGVYLTIGKVIISGGLPYRDIFDQKPPGLYFILALGIRSLGTGLWWPRALMILVNISSAGFLYLIARHWLSRTAALGTSFCYLICIPIFHGQFALTEPWVNLFGLISVSLLISWQKSKKLGFLLLAGVGAGLAVLFKQSALPLVLIEGIAIFKLNRFKTIWVWLIGVVSPGLIGLGWLGSVIGVNTMAYAIVGFYFERYGSISYLQHPRMILGLTLPLIMIWVLVVYYLASFRWKQDRIIWLIILYGILTLPFILYRPYHHYWIQLLPIIILLAFLGLKEIKIKMLWTLLLINMGIIVMGILLYTYRVQYSARIEQLTEILIDGCLKSNQTITYYQKSCPIPYQLITY